jgi:hypothetical protein
MDPRSLESVPLLAGACRLGIVLNILARAPQRRERSVPECGPTPGVSSGTPCRRARFCVAWPSVNAEPLAGVPSTGAGKMPTERKDTAVTILDAVLGAYSPGGAADGASAAAVPTRRPPRPIIFVTGIDGEPARMREAYGADAADFIQKPWTGRDPREGLGLRRAVPCAKAPLRARTPTLARTARDRGPRARLVGGAQNR